jgi:predicted transposase/invertase (TIGR01784 family)
MNFLRYYLSFENPEMFTNFTKEIAELTERSTTMGIEEFILDEVRREAIEENTKNTALKMKKSGIEISLISNITGLSIEEIEKL